MEIAFVKHTATGMSENLEPTNIDGSKSFQLDHQMEFLSEIKHYRLKFKDE